MRLFPKLGSISFWEKKKPTADRSLLCAVLFSFSFPFFFSLISLSYLERRRSVVVVVVVVVVVLFLINCHRVRRCAVAELMGAGSICCFFVFGPFFRFNVLVRSSFVFRPVFVLRFPFNFETFPVVAIGAGYFYHFLVPLSRTHTPCPPQESQRIFPGIRNRILFRNPLPLSWRILSSIRGSIRTHGHP